MFNKEKFLYIIFLTYLSELCWFVHYYLGNYLKIVGKSTKFDPKQTRNQQVSTYTYKDIKLWLLIKLSVLVKLTFQVIQV